jgi:hypothetical protein
MDKTPGQAAPRESFARIKRTISRYPVPGTARNQQGGNPARAPSGGARG